MFSGCSITYGDELENLEKDRFSKNHVNIARCGLSNDMIVMRTIEYIEQNHDVDYVITQFTVPRRSTYWENEYKNKIYPAEYNIQFKYDFHKNVIKDPDTERILIVLSILLLSILLNLFKIKNNLKINKPLNFKFLTLCSVVPLVLWFLMMPYIRYGGYAYLPFGLLIIYYSFFFKSFNITKIVKIFLIFGTIYFSSKNFVRINEELNTIDKFTVNHLKTRQSYPIPYFRDFDVDEKILKNKKILYISKHNWLCSISNLPCIPGFWENLEIMINEKKGYNFIIVNEQDYIDILNHKMRVFNLSENKNRNDFNKEIRSK